MNSGRTMRDRLPMGRVFAVAAVTMLLCGAGMARAAVPVRHEFGKENVLGTSLQVIAVAPSEKLAQASYASALKEITRLNAILGTYDPQSEISRLRTATGPMKCSPELLAVLQACEYWRQKSDGAFNAQLGSLIDAWKQAEKTGHTPDEARLKQMVAEISKPAFVVDEKARTVRRLTGASLNVDALAKGYIVDRALAAARVTGVQGLLVNLGGDIRTWGGASGGAGPWTVGVADPKRAADNAAMKLLLRLGSAAVATSGNYERGYAVAGRKYSHILDPRTGRPAVGVLSSTVTAGDCMTADALATILSVLTPAKGLLFVRAIPGTECLIVAADGKQHASGGWGKLTVAAPPAPAPGVAPAGKQWPTGSALNLTVTIRKSWWRPPLAIWVEDADGKCIKTLAVWGKVKYLGALRTWQRAVNKDKKFIESVSRATRPGGTHRLSWDGTDEQGRPVGPGSYTIRMEVTPDGKKRFAYQASIRCADAPAAATITGSKDAKITSILLEYAPGKAGG